MFSCSLHPSKLLRIWIVAWAILLLWPIWFSALPWWVCLLVDCGVVVWMFVSLRKHHWDADKVLVYSHDSWTLKHGDQQQQLTLYGEFYLSQWLIVLNFKSSTGKRTDLILLPDSTDKDSLRRLRVLLKQMPKAKPAS